MNGWRSLAGIEFFFRLVMLEKGTHMNRLNIILLLIFSHVAHGIDFEVEEKITKVAKERCSSEFKEGEDYNIEALGNGNVKISLLGKKGAGLNGTFTYRKSEWKGKPFVMLEHQSAENERFRTCVSEQSKELMIRYSPVPMSKKAFSIDRTVHTNNEGLITSLQRENLTKDFIPPIVDLKMVNNTDDTIFINELNNHQLKLVG